VAEKVKAVGLISGGLDSELAVRLLQEQGIKVTGVSCTHPFHPATTPGEKPRPLRVAEELGIELVRPDVTDRLLKMLRSPNHGFGKHLNPCIDCRLIYLEQGAKLMKKIGAKFLVTGEVLGQRPMSQRRDAIDIINRDSELAGYILRPLSAKLLPETVPEKEGWVDREKLMDIRGRSRKRQFELARDFGLTQFGSPGGGCLLTMEDFARKLMDLLDHQETLTANDVELLKKGRHFRLSDSAKLAVGKNHAENSQLMGMARQTDLIIKTSGAPGPVGLVRGTVSDSEIETACAIMGRYVKKAEGPVPFVVENGAEKNIVVAPMDRDGVEKYRI